MERNTQLAFQRLSPDVTFINIPQQGLRRNRYGVPYLDQLFFYAMITVPGADTLTYINADVFSDHTFADTINFVMDTVPDKEFMIVGKRQNVTWSSRMDISSRNFDFMRTFLSGSPSREDYIDYFITSRMALDWDEIPPFVVGRPAFDNWLVDYAARSKRIMLIDASKTIRLIHQTIEHDVSHWEDLSSGPDVDFNRRVGAGGYSNGYLWRAQYYVDYNYVGQLVLHAKKRDELWGKIKLFVSRLLLLSLLVVILRRLQRNPRVTNRIRLIKRSLATHLLR